MAQRKLAEQFIREQFHDAAGHNLRAYYTYREPIGFAERLRVHLRQTLDGLLGSEAGLWSEEPYRGLEAFDMRHAPIFHGRGEQTCDVIQRLREQEQAGCPFVAIIGASGSGKTSLARAGVAASLVDHGLDERVKKWLTLLLVPSLAADDLFLQLARELARTVPELADSKAPLDKIAAKLRDDPTAAVELSIAPALERAAQAAGGPVRVLLMLDQMEELWTDQRITADDRERFFNAVEALARGAGLRAGHAAERFLSACPAASGVHSHEG